MSKIPYIDLGNTGPPTTRMYEKLLRRGADLTEQRNAWRDAAIESAREAAALRARLTESRSQVDKYRIMLEKEGGLTP